MKSLSASLAVLGLVATASLTSSTEAILSPGCSTYLEALAQPSNPLAKCRVYTALGFPGLTHAHDHDTAKLASALDKYCATPACTPAQYEGVFKDLQAHCSTDMVPANQAVLGTNLYMWYLSPAQREAVCYQNSAKTGFCVIDSIKEMIERGQFPNSNPNEDDLYGYLQYVSPLYSSRGMNATTTKSAEECFCTSCNQQVANIFTNYYTKIPSPFPLNFDQGLSSTNLNNDLSYNYRSSCMVTLGLPTEVAAANGTAVSADGAGFFKPTNLTESAKGNGGKRPDFGNGAGMVMMAGHNSGGRYQALGAVVVGAIVAAVGML